MTESSAAPIRIVFLGTPAFACPALETLAADSRIQIEAVVTQPDRPAGRGHKLTPPPVRVLAEKLGLPLFQTVSIKKDETLKAHLESLKPDFFITVAFGQILTQAVLDIPKVATVNAHASLLPEFRGANPIQQAILQGCPETGITAMMTELGVDTGPMLRKKTLQIGEQESLGELTVRLSELAGPLLVETLTGMIDGSVLPETQDNALATHAPKCQKEDAILDWAEPAMVLHRRIRAFNPAPGATTFLSGERVKILRAEIIAPNSEEMIKDGKPGQILAIMDTEGVLVATGDGLLKITALQPAGKREMSARDWALGAFKPDTQGQRTFSHFEAPPVIATV